METATKTDSPIVWVTGDGWTTVVTVERVVRRHGYPDQAVVKETGRLLNGVGLAYVSELYRGEG